ncbi:hypothetical protein V6N13_082125 [Hibiscus sabdariffa]
MVVDGCVGGWFGSAWKWGLFDENDEWLKGEGRRWWWIGWRWELGKVSVELGVEGGELNGAVESLWWLLLGPNRGSGGELRQCFWGKLLNGCWEDLVFSRWCGMRIGGDDEWGL